MNKTILSLFSATLLGFVVSASASSEEKVNQQIDARPGGKLIVEVDFGTVNVNAGADSKVTVDAFRRINFGDEAAEKEYLAEAPVAVTANGNTITVRARSSKEARHHHFHHTSMDARYTVRVPKNFSAELNTGGGDLSATELAGDIRADSGGGDLTFSHTQGAVSAKSGGGSIKLDGCDGATEVKTGGGDIVLANGHGVLRARTGGGSVQVRTLAGDADVATGGGELTLQKIDGAIAAETSGGAITASVTTAPLKEISLESSGGSIDLVIPRTAAADITAETGDGGITSDLPLAVTKTGGNHLRGKLNGGGTPVVLRTSSGSISINSASPATAGR